MKNVIIIMRIVMVMMVMIISIIQSENHSVPGQRDDEERDRLSNGWDLLLGGGPWALCWSGEEDYFYLLENIGEDDYFVDLLILAFVLMIFARNTGTTLFSAGAISL